MKIAASMAGGSCIHRSGCSNPPEISPETWLHAMKVPDEIDRYQ